MHGVPDFGDDIDTSHLDEKLCPRLGFTVPRKWSGPHSQQHRNVCTWCFRVERTTCTNRSGTETLSLP